MLMSKQGRRWAYQIALANLRQRKPNLQLPEFNAWATVILLQILLLGQHRFPFWVRRAMALAAGFILAPVALIIQGLLFMTPRAPPLLRQIPPASNTRL